MDGARVSECEWLNSGLAGWLAGNGSVLWAGMWMRIGCVRVCFERRMRRKKNRTKRENWFSWWLNCKVMGMCVCVSVGDLFVFRSCLIYIWMPFLLYFKSHFVRCTVIVKYVYRFVCLVLHSHHHLLHLHSIHAHRII